MKKLILALLEKDENKRPTIKGGLNFDEKIDRSNQINVLIFRDLNYATYTTEMDGSSS